tara:strand:+ start:442 stop:843 length:402 start_codon:yes stop_codon:yes gene_type:complete
MRSDEEKRLIRLLTVAKLNEVWRRPIRAEHSRFEKAKIILQEGKFDVLWKSSNPTLGIYKGLIEQYDVSINLYAAEYRPDVSISCSCLWHKQIYYAHGCCEHIVAFASLLEAKTRGVDPLAVLDQRDRELVPF